MKVIKPEYNDMCHKCKSRKIGYRCNGINFCQCCNYEWKHINATIDVNGRKITKDQSAARHKIGSEVFIMNIKEYSIEKVTILDYTYENEFHEGGIDSPYYKLSNGMKRFRLYYLKEKKRAYKDLLYQLPNKKELLKQIDTLKDNINKLQTIIQKRDETKR